MNAHRQDGTMGRRGGPLVLVSTEAQLQAALTAKEPRIVRLSGNFASVEHSCGNQRLLPPREADLLLASRTFITHGLSGRTQDEEW